MSKRSWILDVEKDFSWDTIRTALSYLVNFHEMNTVTKNHTVRFTDQYEFEFNISKTVNNGKVVQNDDERDIELVQNDERDIELVQNDERYIQIVQNDDERYIELVQNERNTEIVQHERNEVVQLEEEIINENIQRNNEYIQVNNEDEILNDEVVQENQQILQNNERRYPERKRNTPKHFEDYSYSKYRLVIKYPMFLQHMLRL